MNNKMILIPLLALMTGVSVAGWENPPPGFVQKKGKAPPPMAKRLKLIKPAKAGEFRLVPTYVSCSMCWGVKGTVEGLELEYRAAGAAEWKTAEPPMYFDDAENYRGSIFDLDEGTSYEARLVADGKTLAKGKFRTWESDVPIAKTVVLDPKTAKYPIVISDKGSPDGWIRYTVKKGAVLGSDAITNTAIIVVRDATNVILEGLTVQGGGQGEASAIFIEKSKGVRVRNCEIFGFGRVGLQVFTDKAHGYFYYNPKGHADPDPGRAVNWDAGVMIYPGSEEITVERCYIHDPRGRSNSWYYAHPAGMQGIYLFRTEGSIVLRWNDIVGSDLHRWNDAIEGCDNFGAGGGFNRDSDIYGNFLIYANDDCIELDGGMQNVRCFRNRFEAGFTDVSIQGCMVSPVYLYENLFAPCCDEFGRANPCVKTFGFDLYWYAPYAYLRGNCFGSAGYKPVLGPTSRWDWRADNVFCTNDVPASWTRQYPARDLPFMLDRGIIKGVKVKGGAAEPSAVKFVAHSTARQPFRVRKNFVSDWFAVTPSEGVLEKGDTEFTVTFDPSRMKDRRQWRGAFLLRTPEGLSRCMSVYAENTDFEQSARPIEGPRTVYATPEKPIRFAKARKSVTPAEFVFDVKEEGDYWFFVRGKAGRGRTCVGMSVDGSAFKPTLLTMWKTHAAWNFLRPGAAEYTSRKGFNPFHLMPGRHVLRLKPHKGGPVTILDVAVSDQPVAFEPR